MYTPQQIQFIREYGNMQAPKGCDYYLGDGYTIPFRVPSTSTFNKIMKYGNYYYLDDGTAIPINVSNTFNRIVKYCRIFGIKEITHTIIKYRGIGEKVFTYTI